MNGGSAMGQGPCGGLRGVVNRDSVRRCLAACGLGGALLAGCGRDAPEATVLPLVVSVRADGLALPGATVRVWSETRVGAPAGGGAAVSGADGLVRTTAIGVAGTAVRVEVTCPAGHHLAQPAAPFVLGPAGAQPAAPRRIALECARDVAQAVLLVRGSGRAAEPVRVDGREVARLDAEGLAHVLVAMAPRTRFELEVGAPVGDGAARATFTMPAGADVLFFDAPPRPASPAPPSRVRPARPGSTRGLVRMPRRLPLTTRRR